MTNSEKLCLQWNNFNETVTSSFKDLKGDSDFIDVTLVCGDGQRVEAHKVVLASSSPVFKELLKETKHPHPLLYLRGFNSADLLSMIDFLYTGTANILQENLDTFLACAEDLKLKGLTRAKAEKEPEEVAFPEKSTIGQKRSPSTIYSKQALPNSEKQPLNNTFDDTRVALVDDKINAELKDLDDQIKSMITNSDISGGPGNGKMASCNVCGKQGPYNAMPRHVEGNHIIGVTHSCDLCGKVCRSRHALSQHIAGSHQA